jgi:uncharacterized protein
MTQQKDEKMNQDQVVSFLEQHPKFLLEHPSLLSKIEISTDRDDVICLVDRQIKMLREQNTKLTSENDMLHQHLSQLMDVARNNDDLLNRCMTLHQELGKATNLVELLEMAKQQICELFELDGVAFKTFVGSPGNLVFVKQCQRDEFLTLINYHFPDNKPLCGLITRKEIEILFPEPDQHVRSAAFLPIGHQAKFGVLVIGSDDSSHFNPGLGTVFLEFIASVITVYYSNLA